MSKKIRISAVSYINTFPFIQGLENSEISEQIELNLDYPSALKEKDLRAYFRDNIEYHLTLGMRISMNQFFDDLKELQID